MRAETGRRLLVFVICGVGVGCLYLLPSTSARSPERLTGAPRSTETARGSRPVSPTPASATAPAGPSGSTVVRTGASSTTRATAPAEPDRRPSATRTAAPRSTRSAATPEASERRRDDLPPAPVRRIDPVRVTPERLTLSWTAATDNREVVGYRLWLDGFAVATTAETSATVRWFRSDQDEHAVQVRALDEAGNESQTSPTLLVTQPAPDPTPLPSPTPSRAPSTPGPTPGPTAPEASAPERAEPADTPRATQEPS